MYVQPCSRLTTHPDLKWYSSFPTCPSTISAQGEHGPSRTSVTGLQNDVLAENNRPHHNYSSSARENSDICNTQPRSLQSRGQIFFRPVSGIISCSKWANLGEGGGGLGQKDFTAIRSFLFSTISVGNTDAAGEMGASGPHAGSLCL